MLTLYGLFSGLLQWFCNRDYIIYTLVNQGLLRAGSDRNITRKCDLLLIRLDKRLKALSGIENDGVVMKNFEEVEALIDDIDVEKEQLLISCLDLNDAIDGSRAILQATDLFSKDSTAHPPQRVHHLKAYWGIVEDRIAMPSERLKIIQNTLRSGYLFRLIYWMQCRIKHALKKTT